MSKTRLNLTALRRRSPYQRSKAEPSLTQVVDTEGALCLSRRELLGLAGVAAVALPSLGRAAAPAVLGGGELVESKGRVAFRLGNRERWVLDIRQFAGEPRLEVRRSGEHIQIALQGARYPGTELSADLELDLHKGLLGWRMRLHLAAGDFTAEGPWEGWLAGAEPLRGRVRWQDRVCELGGGELRLVGSGEAEYFPSGMLRAHGRPIARVSATGADLAAEIVILQVLGDRDASLMQAPPPRRTLVTLQRGRQRWDLGERLPQPRGGKLSAAPDSFNVLQVETGERRSGRAERALLLDAAGNGSTAGLVYHPSDGRGAQEGGLSAVPLQRPRYAVAYDPQGEHQAVLADFPSEPFWLRQGQCALQVGDGDGAGGFELTSLGGKPRSLRCAPGLLAVMAPLSGAVVEPAQAPAGAGVEFVSNATRLAQVRPIPAPRPLPQPQPQPAPEPQPGPRPPVVEIDPARLQLRVPLGPFTVRVIRPRDLLVLDFRFVNLRLVTAEAQPARLVRERPAEPAYLVANFPPQHIAEQAFLEVAEEFQLTGNEGEELRPPPVEARLSGGSRLVFELPSGTNEIPYTLESLLDWTKYDVVVPPRAVGPPPLPQRLVSPAAGGLMQLTPVLLDPSRGTTPLALPEPDKTPGPVLPMLRREEPIRPGMVQPGLARPAEGATVVERAPGMIVHPEIVEAVFLAGQPIEEPKPEETALEAPYRLILSPQRMAGWVHAVQPVEREGRTELWHTRLGVKSQDGSVFDLKYQYQSREGRMVVVNVSLAGDPYGYFRTLRAVWSPDYSTTLPTHSNAPFRMSLDRRDRCELVWLTSDFKIAEARSRVIQADRVMLSSLGAWLFTRYAAPKPLGVPLTIEEWRHQAAMGRDQFVRVVYKGYLFPFGHAASLVKVTERRFVDTSSGRIAYLRQRFFIIVREPEKLYPSVGQGKDARGMPLRRVRITSLITPNLNDPNASRVTELNISGQSAFWPRVGNRDYAFQMVGEDWDGQHVEFSVPTIFVGVENVQGSQLSLAFDRANLAEVVTHYLKPQNNARREAALFGQKMAFAECSADRRGDTTLEVEKLVFGAELDDAAQNLQPLDFERLNQPRCYPLVAEAAVRMPAVAHLTGSAGAARIKIATRYLDHAWNPTQNKGEVFLELVQAAALAFPGDKSGGLAAPNLDIKGISRAFGPLGGDINKLAQGQFDPLEFFSDAAKIFGVISLREIIEAVFSEVQVPNLSTKVEYDANDIPEAVIITYTWKPKVKSFPATGKPIFAADSNTVLEIVATMRVDLRGQPPQSKVEAKLAKFAVNLIPMGDIDYFFRIRFTEIKFLTELGKKPDVSTDLAGVDFGGPLDFVKKLKDLLPLGSFGDLFNLDIGLTGIVAGFSLPLPSVAVGVFTLKDMTLGAGFELSFTDQPLRVRFNFCERHRPFTLTVSMFGGGGFFALAVNLSGLELLEASFEFGGNFSFDIGVASGGVYLMAGVYFKLEGGAAELTGYVRMGGNLSVLGLINISLEFYLSMTYLSQGNQVWGRAKLTVEISILFFSFSVALEVEKRFAGSSASAHYLDGARLAQAGGAPGLVAGDQPPSFEDLMSRQDWREYCEAFA